MTENQVTVVALFTAKPGMEETVRQAIEAVIAPTRAEPGCMNYDLHQSSEDPSIFMLYENWNSKKDLDDHLAMPYLKDLAAKAEGLLAKPLDIQRYRRISQKA
jgi:quinol monooxygenase YgiN